MKKVQWINPQTKDIEIGYRDNSGRFFSQNFLLLFKDVFHSYEVIDADPYKTHHKNLDEINKRIQSSINEYILLIRFNRVCGVDSDKEDGYMNIIRKATSLPDTTTLDECFEVNNK